MQITLDMRIKIATMLGMPFFCIQNSGGAQIIDKKAASKNGTISTDEAFIPATIIINAANLTRELFCLYSVFIKTPLFEAHSKTTLHFVSRFTVSCQMGRLLYKFKI